MDDLYTLPPFDEAQQIIKENQAFERNRALPEAAFSVNFKVTGTDGIDYQFTTRAWTLQELMKNIADLKAKVANGHKAEKQGEVTTTVSATCPIHNVQMDEKQGKYGAFWSHSLGKNTDGTTKWCNGK